MSGVDQLREVNRYVSEYIRFADAKATVILTGVGAIGAALGVVGPVVLDGIRAKHPWAHAVGCIALGAVALSVLFVVWHAFSALRPRVDTNASLVSFPTIATLDPGEYAKRALALTPPDEAEQYALHNATLSRIAMAKYGAISSALCWARVAIFATYLAVIAYGVLKATG